ncbi:uncharacterized protein [Dysidea avara]|uniref:uncharacterized protein n=1 Tax=Dysidea avara TaxID=196820 RepID=UPI00331DB0F6
MQSSHSSRWPVVWFFLSALVVIYECGFVLLRPHTLPGGKFHDFFTPYDEYIKIDKGYGNIKDEFVWAGTWMNIIEVLLQFLTILLILRRSSKAVLIGFLVSALTFWKTLLYVIQFTELCNGSHRLRHVDTSTAITLFIIPNAIWLVFPSIMMIYFGSKLFTALDNTRRVKKD